MQLVPQSWGSPLREFNQCHSPAGTPAGGKFCSATRIRVTTASQLSFDQAFPIGQQRRFLFDPSTGQLVLGQHLTSIGTALSVATEGAPVDVGGTHAEEFDYAKRRLGAKGLNDAQVKGVVTRAYRDRPGFIDLSVDGQYLPGGEDPQAAEFDAAWKTVEMLVRAGAPRETIFWSHGAIPQDSYKSLADGFPSLFKRRRLREFNQCHAPADGRFCSDGGTDGRGMDRWPSAPVGGAPGTDWSAQDLQDAGRSVTEATILRDYGRSKDPFVPAVYRAYVPLSDLDERLAEEDDAGEYQDEGGGYDWSELQRGRGNPPPIKVEVMGDGRLVILDGNHRVRFWRDRNYDDAPAWVLDYRPAAGAKRQARRRRLKEFNKCHAPADGKFCSTVSGLGLTSKGEPLKPFDFWAKMPDEIPDPPDTPVGVQIGSTSPGHESWRVDWYSFPKDGAYEARQLGSFPVKAISVPYKDVGSKPQSLYLEQVARNRGLVAPPGYMLIYRLGAPGEKSIAGRNGANADGLVNFIDRTNEDLKGTGDTVYVYAVKLRKPLGAYREYRGFREAVHDGLR